VVLFGSRARGEAHEESDWDIADILKTEDAGAARDDAIAFVAFCERLIDES
jgi:predicted nucleotidyltransferase